MTIDLAPVIARLSETDRSALFSAALREGATVGQLVERWISIRLKGKDAA